MTFPDLPSAKPSWPLVALAVAAFIPGVGFLCGAAAVTWGLLSDLPRARLAIGIGATGALLQVLAGIGLVVSLKDTPALRQAQVAITTADLTTLVTELDAYAAETGRYPATLLLFVGYPIPRRLINVHDQSASIITQRLFTYRLAADGRTFDLFAVGPDGLPDTDDDIRPVLPDTLLPRTGYRPPQ